MSRLLVSQRAFTTPNWIKNDLWKRARAVPSLDLRFAESKSLTDAVTGQSLVSFTRASSGTYVGSDGLIKTAAVNEPRFDHNPITGESLGLLVEEQRTNSIRNNTMVGAVAGTPGTLPTNWSVGGNSGLSREVVGTGIENGISYIDIRLFGTVASVATPEFTFLFEQYTGVAAVQNQTWTGSAYVKIVGGSLNGIVNGELFILENNILGVVIGASSSTYSYSQLTGVLPSCRVSHTRTLAGASTAFVVNRVDINFIGGGGSVVDCTLRIGLPQLEQGAFATSVIPTTTAAATRSADVASITGTAFSSWYRQDEGTVFAEFGPYANGSPIASSNYGIFGVSNGAYATGNHIFAGGGTSPVFTVQNSGTLAYLSTGALTPSALNKIGAAYKSDDFARSFNGTSATIDTSGSVPTGLTQADIGKLATVVNQLNGTIRRLSYWPVRLRNETLQQITQ